MCVYCFCGDWEFRRNPPWYPNDPVTPWPPTVPLPSPSTPINPWKIDQLKEYLDLLKQIKALEDQIGCPCEPNKADYIGLLKKRIEALEAENGKTTTGVPEGGSSVAT